MSDWVYYGCQAMQKRNVKESIQFTVKVIIRWKQIKMCVYMQKGMEAQS